MNNNNLIPEFKSVLYLPYEYGVDKEKYKKYLFIYINLIENLNNTKFKNILHINPKTEVFIEKSFGSTEQFLELSKYIVKDLDNIKYIVMVEPIDFSNFSKVTAVLKFLNEKREKPIEFLYLSEILGNPFMK